MAPETSDQRRAIRNPKFLELRLRQRAVTDVYWKRADRQQLAVWSGYRWRLNGSNANGSG